MSDSSIDVDPGTGTGKLPVGFDLVSSVYIQKTKIVVGPLGTSQYPQLGSQTTAGSLAVVLASDQVAIPVTGATGGTQYDEDTPHVSGDKLTMAGVVQQTADAALAGDGDRTALQVDSTGYLKVNIKAGGSSGTQYAEDSAHVSGDLVTLAGVVQQAADTALSSDGDRSLLQVDANGFLKVNIKAGAGSGGTAAADRAAFTAGTTSGTPMMGVRDDTSPATVAEDLLGIARITTNRALHTNLRDASGVEIGSAGTALFANPRRSDGTEIFISTVPGFVVGAETVDLAISSRGLAIAARASAATPTAMSADGDAVQLWANLNGALRIDPVGTTTQPVDTELPAPAALADGTVNPTTPLVGAALEIFNGVTWDRWIGTLGAAFVHGPLLHDAAANITRPVAIGGFASAAAPADVSADNDIVKSWFLRNGAQATVLTAAGALIGGDAANGLDVDVTRVTGTVTVDTELTAVAALADATANPTITNSQRLTITAANAAKVDGSAVTQPVSIAATVTVSDTATLVDNAAFTDGTTRVLMNGFIFDEVAGTALTENDAAAARIDSKRAIVMVIEDATARGTRAAVTANGLQVQQATAANFNATVVGTKTNDNAAPGATNVGVLPALCNTSSPTFTNGNMTTLSVNTSGQLRIQGVQAEDSGHVSADVGVFALAVRKDNPAATAVTSADADYSPISVDDKGVQWIRPRQMVTYSAIGRLADATAGRLSLAFLFVANTNKQLLTIYHTGASTKIVKIRRISILLASSAAAGIYNFEVRALSATTAPATGNPAITPRQHDPADAAVEAAVLALPTTAGSLVGADTGTVGVGHEWNSGIGAATTNSAGQAGAEIVLFDQRTAWDGKPLIMRAATAEGYAVNGRCTVATTLQFIVNVEFTEE